jgi:hypothetical protein
MKAFSAAVSDQATARSVAAIEVSGAAASCPASPASRKEASTFPQTAGARFRLEFD